MGPNYATTSATPKSCHGALQLHIMAWHWHLEQPVVQKQQVGEQVELGPWMANGGCIEAG